MEELKSPVHYVRRTWLRENQNLRESLRSIILPPTGGRGPAGLSAVLRACRWRGILARGKICRTPNFVALSRFHGRHSRPASAIRVLPILSACPGWRFAHAVQTSASLPVAGGMREMVNGIRRPRHAGARQRVLSVSTTKKAHHLRLRRQAVRLFSPGTRHHRRRQFRWSRRGPTKARHFRAFQRTRHRQRPRHNSGRTYEPPKSP